MSGTVVDLAAFRAAKLSLSEHPPAIADLVRRGAIRITPSGVYDFGTPRAHGAMVAVLQRRGIDCTDIDAAIKVYQRQTHGAWIDRDPHAYDDALLDDLIRLVNDGLVAAGGGR